MAPHSFRVSCPHPMEGVRVQGATKGRAELQQNEAVQWSAGPRQAICTQTGLRHEDKDLRQEGTGGPGTRAVPGRGLDGQAVAGHPEGKPGGGHLPAPCPSGSSAAASLHPFPWTLPSHGPVATSPELSSLLLPRVPAARGPRPGQPLPQSL